MESLLLSAKVVFPLFVFMALGYLLNMLGFLGKETKSQMNKLVFKLFLPVSIFVNIYTSDIEMKNQGGLIAFAVVTIIAVFVILCLIIPRFENIKSRASVIIQVIYRSNFVLFGLTVTQSIYGDEGVGTTAVLVAIVVPVFNALAVILFEIFRGGKINFLSILKGTVTNPLIIASVAGLIVSATGIEIPGFVMETVKDIGGLATPLALIILGATFAFGDLRIYKMQLVTSVCGRLLLMPAIFLGIGILLGFRNHELVALMSLSASPTAVSSFTMADQMGGDGKLAGGIVVLTSIGAVFSIFMWTFVLNINGLI